MCGWVAGSGVGVTSHLDPPPNMAAGSPECGGLCESQWRIPSSTRRVPDQLQISLPGGAWTGPPHTQQLCLALAPPSKEWGEGGEWG